MRILPALVVLGLLVPAAARADRLIQAPTGRKILSDLVRVEHMFELSNTRRSFTFLGKGLTQSLEAEFSLERKDGLADRGAIDVGYSLVDPIVGLAPGITLGVRDLLGQGSFGRYVYAAITWRLGLDGEFNQDVPLEVSLGYIQGDRNGFTVGVMAPFSSEFRLLTEYDARDVTAGIEVRPFRSGSVRWLFRERETLLSVALFRRF